MLTVARAAGADSFGGYRSTDLSEKAHAIDVVLHRGYADFDVVRTIHNGSTVSDQATIGIDLPTGAVATSLRTRSRVAGVDVWFPGELLEAELAAARYRELTGIGGHYPKDPALLSWVSQSSLILEVFPCPANADKAVGYGFRLPTAFAGGRDGLELPPLGTADVPARATLRAARAGDRIFVDGVRVERPVITLDEPHTIELAPSAFDPVLETSVASVGFDAGKNLVRARFDAAPRLGEVPRGASVVVVLDASRSMDELKLEASQRAAQAYLSNFEDAQTKVAVLAFDRKVRAVTSGFVSPKTAVDALDAPLERKNGSHVDLAMLRARELLLGAREGAPRRIVLFTDRLARGAVDPSTLAKAPGAVVHFVDVAGGSSDLERDDGDAWAFLPRSTGGLLFRGGADATARADMSAETWAAERARFEVLARPTKLENLRVAGPEGDLGWVSTPIVLDEGESFGGLAVRPRALSTVSFEGELWSKPVRRVVSADVDASKRLAGDVFGTELLDELDEPEMMTLARAGGVVSPVTSYLAIEPGVRPSTEGLDWANGIGDSFGAAGFGLVGIGEGGGGAGEPMHLTTLSELFGDAAARCNATKAAHVTIETTFAEIVDVTVRVRGEDADERARCLGEAVWETELPADFTRAHASESVDL